MARHGSPKDENYNIFTALISVSIQLFLVVNAIRIGFWNMEEKENDWWKKGNRSWKITILPIRN